MNTTMMEYKVSYIASMLRELHKMADEENLDMLCYFLSMAIIEAEQIYSDGVIIPMEANA